MNVWPRGYISKALQQIVNNVIQRMGGGGYQCEWMLQQKVRNVGVQFLSCCLSPTVPVYDSSFYLLIPCIMWWLYYCLSTIDSAPALVYPSVLDFPSFSPPGLAFGAFFIWQLQTFLLGEEEEVLMSSRISLPAVRVWGHARGLTVTACVLLPMVVLISQTEIKNDWSSFLNQFCTLLRTVQHVIIHELVLV